MMENTKYGISLGFFLFAKDSCLPPPLLARKSKPFPPPKKYPTVQWVAHTGRIPVSHYPLLSLPTLNKQQENGFPPRINAIATKNILLQPSCFLFAKDFRFTPLGCFCFLASQQTFQSHFAHSCPHHLAAYEQQERQESCSSHTIIDHHIISLCSREAITLGIMNEE